MSNFNETQIEILETIGNVWEKHGKSRVYFNDKAFTKFIGLDIEFYKTGNVCSVSWDGVEYSNTKGTEIWQALTGMFLDLNTGKFSFKMDFHGWASDIVESFEAALEAAVDEAVTAKEAIKTLDVTITVNESETPDDIADKFEAEFGTRPVVTTGSETIARVDIPANTLIDNGIIDAARKKINSWLGKTFPKPINRSWK